MTKPKIPFTTIAFALITLSILACDPAQGTSYVLITGIPTEYNEQKGVIHIKEEEESDVKGEGIVKNGELIAELIYANRLIGGFFGGASTSVKLELENNKFVYTDSKTFQELQIDVCDSFTEFLNKLPKVYFAMQKAKWGASSYKDETTVIEFDKFKEWNTDNCLGN